MRILDMGELRRFRRVIAAGSLVIAGAVTPPAHSASATASSARWVPTNVGVHYLNDRLAAFPDGRGVFATLGPWPNASIFHTTDYGLTWTPVPASPDTPFFGDVAFGSASVGYGIQWGAALHRTSDGGRTWSRTAPLPYNSDTMSAGSGLFVGQDGRMVVVGSERWCRDPLRGVPIRHSFDGGDSWSATLIPGAGTIKAIDFIDTSHGIVLGRIRDRSVKGPCETPDDERPVMEYVQQLWYTSNGGKSYRRLDLTGSGEAAGFRGEIADVRLVAPNRIVILRRSGDVAISDDLGGSYRIVARLATGGGLRGDQPSHGAVDFVDSRIGYIAYDGAVWRTADGGETWTPEPLSYPTTTWRTVHLAAFDPDHAIMLASEDVLLTRVTSP